MYKKIIKKQICYAYTINNTEVHAPDLGQAHKTSTLGIRFNSFLVSKKPLSRKSSLNSVSTRGYILRIQVLLDVCYTEMKNSRLKSWNHLFWLKVLFSTYPHCFLFILINNAGLVIKVVSQYIRLNCIWCILSIASS